MHPRDLIPFLCLLALLPCAASAETPRSLWQEIPPLPADAADAYCDTDELIKEIEYAGEDTLVAAQNAIMQAGAPGPVSDRQGQALAVLMDESLQACINEAETMRRERLEPPVAELRRRVAALVDEAAQKSGRCDNGTFSENCGLDVGKRYQARLQSEAQQFLTGARAIYGTWSKKVKACIDAREDAYSGFVKAKITGPFAGQGLNIRTQTWMLVHSQATTQRKLCRAAYQAAHALDGYE